MFSSSQHLLADASRAASSNATEVSSRLRLFVQAAREARHPSRKSKCNYAAAMLTPFWKRAGEAAFFRISDELTPTRTERSMR